RTIRKILAEVDADGSISIWWREGIIDLLLDERHATLLGLAANELVAFGWEVVPELSIPCMGSAGRSISSPGTLPPERCSWSRSNRSSCRSRKLFESTTKRSDWRRES